MNEIARIILRIFLSSIISNFGINIAKGANPSYCLKSFLILISSSFNSNFIDLKTLYNNILSEVRDRAFKRALSKRLSDSKLNGMLFGML